jgi:hypothetical protein
LTAIDPDLDCISRVRFGTHWQWRLPERLSAVRSSGDRAHIIELTIRHESAEGPTHDAT